MSDLSRTHAVHKGPLDPSRIEPTSKCSYPAKFAAPCRGRWRQVLGDPCGLTHFGVNLVTLEPGAWSAQRHWRSHEDEFIFVLDGEATLVTDRGEEILCAGQAAGFPAGEADGHHLVNRSDRPLRYLEIGTRCGQDQVTYPDIDLLLKHSDGRSQFVNLAGKAYEEEE